MDECEDDEKSQREETKFGDEAGKEEDEDAKIDGEDGDEQKQK